MALFKKHKEDKDESMVLADYKEEFSWRVFWDEQIVGRYKKVRKFLKDHGVLFFLLSPFQYKNRLIVKIVLVFAGVMIGIVPRGSQMLNATKARNAASEISETKTSGAGPITVTPMASSQYKRQHVLAFTIDGSTADGVPSTKSGFSVTLRQNRGVSDPWNVSYKYDILPVSDSRRLLVLYVDNRKQTDKTGIYNLRVQIKNNAKMETPMELVISDGQRTTDLFGKDGINLAALSNSLTNDSGGDQKAIKTAQKTLKSALHVYKLNEARLKEMGMTISPSYDEVVKLADKYSILTDVTDTSTVDVTVGKDLPIAPTIGDITSKVTAHGKTYSSSDSVNNDDDDDDDNNNTGESPETELSQLETYLGNVTQAVSDLNSARLAKFTSLKNVESILTKKVDPANMGETYWVAKKN